MPSVRGFDTETTLGYVKLLRHSDGAYVETDDTIRLLDFLFDEGMKADYNVFWNVRFDFGSVVKGWVVAQAPRLKENHRTAMRDRKKLLLLEGGRLAFGEPMDAQALEERLERRRLRRELRELESVEHFNVGKYRILYIPKKGFRVTRAQRQRGRNSVCFFDAMPFYATGVEDAARLETMAQRYLGRGKSDEERGIDVAALGSQPGYYEAHREAILGYCLDDCKLTAELFAKVIEGFERIGFPFPEQPWSRASVGRELLRVGSPKNGIPPGLLEPTREAYEKLSETGSARLWERAYAGACILNRGVGAWTDVSKWDINSAYPRPMVDFPSLEGAFIVGPEDPRFDACYFKFYEVDLVPTPRRALPDRAAADGRLLYTEGGEPRRVCVTALDLELFDDWGDAYTVVDAVGVVTPSRERPLSFMRTLYRRKTEVKREFGEDSVEYLNAKIPLNGIYGIVAQSRPRAGRYTNFIYAAYVTAWARRELWRKTKEVVARGGTVLAQMTDGLFVSGYAPLPEPSKELGAWDVEHLGLVVLFANGIYYIPKKASPTWDGLKKRGAPDLGVDDLMAADRPYVHTSRTRPLGLKQAVIRGTPELIGCFLPDEKDLCPARMLEDSGLRMDLGLRAAPLSSFFTRSWFLDHRATGEAPIAPQALLEANVPMGEEELDATVRRASRMEVADMRLRVATGHATASEMEEEFYRLKGKRPRSSIRRKVYRGFMDGADRRDDG